MWVQNTLARRSQLQHAPQGFCLLAVSVRPTTLLPRPIVLNCSQRSSAALQLANPKAEVARRGQALQLNINAALGLQEVVKTNLGPKGTIK
eukprot:jgi/Hompol1/6962/HPOL_001016-RA